MNRKTLVLFLLMILKAPAAVSLTCAEFFAAPAHAAPLGRRIDSISSEIKRVRADGRTILRFEELRLGYYAAEPGRRFFTVRAESHDDRDEGLLRTPVEVQDDPGLVALYRNVLAATAEEAVSWERGRRDFTEGQLSALSSEPIQLEGRFTHFLAVEDGRLIGALRLNSAPYNYVVNLETGEARFGDSELPAPSLALADRAPPLTSVLLMERILGVQLPRPTPPSPWRFRDERGRSWQFGSFALTEPGAYFVDPDVRNRGEILAVFAYQYWMYLYRGDGVRYPMMDPNAQSHFTWATNRLGARLHAFNSFTPFTAGPTPRGGEIILGTSSDAIEGRILSPLGDRRLPRELMEALRWRGLSEISEMFPRFAWTLESPLVPAARIDP